LIQAVVFDLGNVLFNIDFDLPLQAFSNHTNSSIPEIKAAIKNPLFESYERGKTSTEALVEYVNKEWSCDLSIASFEKLWCSILRDQHPKMEELLVKLQSKYRLAALSNTNQTHQAVWTVRFENLLQHMDFVLCSHECGYIKPEAPIFELLIEKLAIPPETILFLDDVGKNVKGARELGLQAFQTYQYEEVYKCLNQHLELQF